MNRIRHLLEREPYPTVTEYRRYLAALPLDDPEPHLLTDEEYAAAKKRFDEETIELRKRPTVVVG